MRRRLVFAGFILCTVWLGCSPSSAPPTPTIPGGPEGLFFEPPEFCLANSQSADSLTVYNLGTQTLEWATLHLPAGLTGIPDTFLVSPDTGLLHEWEWDTTGPFPITDSIVGATRPVDQAENILSYRVVIPVRRVAADYVDIEPPTPPVLALPENEARYRVGDDIPVWWSRVTDCSGIAHYQIQVSADPGFTNILCCESKLNNTYEELTVDPGDEGRRAYLRVVVRDNQGLVSVSETRTWFVE